MSHACLPFFVRALPCGLLASFWHHVGCGIADKVPPGSISWLSLVDGRIHAPPLELPCYLLPGVAGRSLRRTIRSDPLPVPFAQSSCVTPSPLDISPYFLGL